MPVDHPVSFASYTKRGTKEECRIPNDLGPAQSLEGFEETYRNIVDYIVRITHRIWEDRDVEYIRKTYSPDSWVFDDYGLQLGNEKIVADTYHTTGAFSDIQPIADEVIWAGDNDTGFHTSHRVLIRGTNDGPSKYGPATGRKIDVLVLANCVVKKNEIYLEHVLYNTSAMLQQLGLDVDAEVKRLVANAPEGWPRSPEVWNELRQASSPDVPVSIAEPVSGFDPDRFVRDAFERIWKQRDPAAAGEFYEDGFAFDGPGDRSFSGVKAYGGFVGSIFDTFPDLSPQVDEAYWMIDGDACLISTRWSAEGSHTGRGLYGGPSGAPVQLWGITQQEIQNGRICREWMLFNEIDVMMQIEAGRRNA